MPPPGQHAQLEADVPRSRCLGRDYCPIGGVAAGDASSTFQVTASCTTETLAPVTVTYHWNTGQSSTVHYAVNSVTRLAHGSDMVVAVGTVTAGLDQEAAAEAQIMEPVLDSTACSGSVVTEVIGPETLTFTG